MKTTTRGRELMDVLESSGTCESVGFDTHFNGILETTTVFSRLQFSSVGLIDLTFIRSESVSLRVLESGVNGKTE